MAAQKPLVCINGIWQQIPAGDYLAGISPMLDALSAVQGSVLFRGAATWTALAPGTSGQVLVSKGATANPVWQDGSMLGGGSSDPWTKYVAATNLTENASVATNVFSFNAPMATNYLFECNIIGSGDSSNLGVVFGMSLTSGSTSQMHLIGPMSNGGQLIVGNANDSGNFTNNTGQWINGGQKALLILRIMVQVSAAGTIALQFKKSGSGTFTIYAGSNILYRTI